MLIGDCDAIVNLIYSLAVKFICDVLGLIVKTRLLVIINFVITCDASTSTAVSVVSIAVDSAILGNSKYCTVRLCGPADYLCDFIFPIDGF